MPDTIVLLDLNYTLVSNSAETWRKDYTHDIPAEQYREWLITLLKPHRVMLVTVRAERLREETLASIQEKTGWLPESAYFSPRSMKAAVWKRQVLYALRDKFPGASFVAVESNPRTQAMYGEEGVPCLRVVLPPKDPNPAPTQSQLF